MAVQNTQPQGRRFPPRLDVELTSACNHRCAHCYNVWTTEEAHAPVAAQTEQLATREHLALMEKAVRQGGAEHVTLTGGEPLLHDDALAFVARATALVPSVQLVTNGSQVSPGMARSLADLGLRSAQLTLLSHDRERHDRWKGVRSFDQTLRAILDLRDAGVPVQLCFVALRQNWQDFQGVLELCCALKVRSVAYNRMSPSGGAVRAIAGLLPTPDEVEHNLATADRLGRAWGIQVSTAMPIPPCLIRIERYRWVRFGFCSVGSATPNWVMDPLGNVRNCNLSAEILGNLRTDDWSQIRRRARRRPFRKTLPAVCRGCAHELGCKGGCKEAAVATWGDLAHPEPFLHLGLDPSWRTEHDEEPEP